MNIRKLLLILLFSSFVGIISNPEMPLASDSVAVTGINDGAVMQTVELTEPVAEEAITETSADEANGESSYTEPSYAESVYDEPTYEEQVYEEPIYEEPVYEEPVYEEPVYQAPANAISINGRTIDLAYTETTGEDAGGAGLAWYYKTGKFIYGHNSWNVFGFLNSAYDGGWLDGTSFSVTMDGQTQYYTVVNYRLYDYDAGDSTHLWYNGESTKMNPIVKAKLDGVSYRMAIMTCYAGSSKRLVVFAN